MMNLLEDEIVKWQETAKPKITFNERMDKFAEECEEFVEAVKIYLDNPSRDRRIDMIMEAADVAIVLQTILGITDDSLSDAMQAKLQILQKRLESGYYDDNRKA